MFDRWFEQDQSGELTIRELTAVLNSTNAINELAPTALALLGVIFAYYYAVGSLGTQLLGGYVCTARVRWRRRRFLDKQR